MEMIIFFFGFFSYLIYISSSGDIKKQIAIYIYLFFYLNII